VGQTTPRLAQLSTASYAPSKLSTSAKGFALSRNPNDELPRITISEFAASGGCVEADSPGALITDDHGAVVAHIGQGARMRSAFPEPEDDADHIVDLGL
jgi:hypothetical protein